jgi:hypothetical protein
MAEKGLVQRQSVVQSAVSSQRKDAIIKQKCGAVVVPLPVTFIVLRAVDVKWIYYIASVFTTNKIRKSTTLTPYVSVGNHVVFPSY